MSDWLQVVIAGAIIVFMLYAIWRSGSQNPVGTGQLQKQLNTIGAEVRGLTDKVGECALKSEIEGLRDEISRMEKGLATSAEVVAVEGKINVLKAEIEGWGGAVRRVEGMVQRIEGILVKKALAGE